MSLFFRGSKLFALTAISCAVPMLAQQGGPVPLSTAPIPGPVAPSTLVQPSLANLHNALAGVNADKWKVPKSVKDMTLANVESIRRDMDQTLPGLLSAADAKPNSVLSMLPVQQNLGALYDVLLRVTVVADAAAPDEQTHALEASMAQLEGARRSFYERLMSDAQAEDKHIADLQKTVSARAETPQQAATPPPACVPPKPTSKKKTSKTTNPS